MNDICLGIIFSYFNGVYRGIPLVNQIISDICKGLPLLVEYLCFSRKFRRRNQYNMCVNKLVVCK